MKIATIRERQCGEYYRSKNRVSIAINEIVNDGYENCARKCPSQREGHLSSRLIATTFYRPRNRGSSVSRKASPRKLMENTTIEMAKPGKTANHHAVRMYF